MPVKQKTKGPEKKMLLQFETTYKGHELEVYSKDPVPEGAKLDDLLLQSGIAFKEGEHWLTPFEREEMREESYNFEKNYGGKTYLFSTKKGDLENLPASDLMAKTMDVKVYDEGGELVSIPERRKMLTGAPEASKEAEEAAKGAGIVAAAELKKQKKAKAEEAAKGAGIYAALEKEKEGKEELLALAEETLPAAQKKKKEAAEKAASEAGIVAAIEKKAGATEEKKAKAEEAAKSAGIYAATELEKKAVGKPAEKEEKPKYSKEADALLAALGAPVAKKEKTSETELDEVMEAMQKAKKQKGEESVGLAGTESEAAEIKGVEAEAAKGKVTVGGKEEGAVKQKEPEEAEAKAELKWPGDKVMAKHAADESTATVNYTFTRGGEQHTISVVWEADTSYPARERAFGKALEEGKISSKPDAMSILTLVQIANIKEAYIDGVKVSSADLEALNSAVKAGQLKLKPYSS